jgi:acyl-CoA reductase-like NAD-dependent aldehyde dehydrogenase
MISQEKAGTVWVNTYNIFDAALPFGGYEQPDWGVRWAGRSSTSTGKPNRSASDCPSGADTTRMQ